MTHVTEVTFTLPHARKGKDEQAISFEKICLPYLVAIPLLYVLGSYAQMKKCLWKQVFRKEPSINIWFIDGLSRSSRKVKEGQARWPALNTVYNFHEGVGDNTLVRTIDSWWLNVRNAQAVRNRFKIVKAVIRTAILEQSQNRRRDQPVKLLSLAAGSAQPVLEVVAELRKEGVLVEMMLIDQDRSAIAEILDRVEELGLTGHTTIRRGLVEKFERHAGEFQPDIVEMCGYMDYFSVQAMTDLLRRVHEFLPPGGQFLTCHVHPNHEAYFLRHVVNWWMWYKSFPDFHSIIVGGGFSRISYQTEPHKIHTVAVARK